MDITGVDPRDIQWEVEDPVYRVYFWGVPGNALAGVCDEWRIVGAADVEEVLRWGRQQAQGRVVVVYVESADGQARGLLRVHGREPQRGCGGTVGSPAVAVG